MSYGNNNLARGTTETPAPVPFTVQQVEKFTVVEFRGASLMDPVELENIGQALYRLVDAEDRRRIVLTMNKKLGALKNSKLVLCGIGPRLQELLKITRLDRVLTIKPSQREAVMVA